MSFFQQLEKLLQQDGKSASETLAELGTPFVSIGIIEKNQISTTVIGSPDHDSSTIFQACSISKPITALAVMKLAQQGQLNLDASISSYLSPTQLSNISTNKTKDLMPSVTLRHLLSHTSGLSVHGFPGYPPNTPNPLPTPAEILTGKPPTNTCAVKPTAFPGQRFSYSGGGFTLIQYILENHFRKPFPDLMQEIVLSPLKMNRSSYRHLDESVEKNWAPAYYTGYLKADPEYHLLPESAAAGLWTTPHDLLLVVQAVQMSLGWGGGADGEEGPFLEKKWAEEMVREVGGNGVGLGWFVKSGLERFWHLGSNDPGYRCMLLGSMKQADNESTSSSPSGRPPSTTKPPTPTLPPNSGISIMTSSAQGLIVIEKLYAAICYLKNWSSGIGSGSFGSFGGISLMTPLIDYHDASSSGRGFVDAGLVEAWLGRWGDWELLVVLGGKGGYEGGRDGDGDGEEIEGDDDGVGDNKRRCLGIRYTISKDFPVMHLFPAAIDSRVYGEEKGMSFDFVVEGLEIMFRLGWRGEERVVERWQDGEVRVLVR